MARVEESCRATNHASPCRAEQPMPPLPYPETDKNEQIEFPAFES